MKQLKNALSVGSGCPCKRLVTLKKLIPLNDLELQTKMIWNQSGRVGHKTPLFSQQMHPFDTVIPSLCIPHRTDDLVKMIINRSKRQNPAYFKTTISLYN